MTHPFLLPDHVRVALNAVLTYVMPDEELHYACMPARKRRRHIYKALVTLRQWLDAGAGGKADLDTPAIQDLLEAHGYLATIWSVEDVQSVRPDLADDQCREVLHDCGRHHDAEIGINWTVISTVADDLFPRNG